MDGVAETLGIETIAWRGRSLRLPRPNFVTEAAWRRHLEAADYRGLQAHRQTLGAADYQSQLTSWRRDCTAGVWAWGTADNWRAMQEKDNFLELILLCLCQVEGQELDRPEVDALLKDQQAEVVEAFNRLLMPTPTTPPPATAPAGATL
jgi:hypothetical protein